MKIFFQSIVNKISKVSSTALICEVLLFLKEKSELTHLNLYDFEHPPD